MRWLRRLRRPPLRPAESGEAAGGRGRAVERASPGLAALFSRLEEDGRHVVLDLGPASEAHLRLLRRWAGRVRFADLLPTPPRGAALAEVLGSLPPHPERPYDVVLAWNVLDLLEDRERAALVARLHELTAPGAMLHALVEPSDGAVRPAVRFTLTDAETVSREPLGVPIPGGRPLLPAHVERVLEPFDVVRGFTLRGGLREYLAVKAGVRR